MHVRAGYTSLLLQALSPLHKQKNAWEALVLASTPFG